MSLWLLEPTPGEVRLVARRRVLHGRELERDRGLPIIDVVHHLYAAYKAGHPIQWFLACWTKDELMAVLEYLYREIGPGVAMGHLSVW